MSTSQASMSEREKRQHRCCFTGHRPEKLTMAEADVISWLESEIRNSIDEGFVTFISGMARGVDIWAAEIVLRLKDEGKQFIKRGVDGFKCLAPVMR